MRLVVGSYNIRVYVYTIGESFNGLNIAVLRLFLTALRGRSVSKIMSWVIGRSA